MYELLDILLNFWRNFRCFKKCFKSLTLKYESVATNAKILAALKRGSMLISYILGLWLLKFWPNETNFKVEYMNHKKKAELNKHVQNQVFCTYVLLVHFCWLLSSNFASWEWPEDYIFTSTVQGYPQSLSIL